MIIHVTGAYYTAVFYALAGLIGLCVGSFLNVVIYRVPLNMSVVKPASHCPACGYTLRWYDNIPLISYCILGGKCRKCKKHISFRYTAVEAANMLLWLGCAIIFRSNLIYALIAMAVSSVCICVFFIDLEHMIIPDRFQVILCALGIAAIFFDTTRTWYSHLIAAVACSVLFFIVSFIVGKVLGREALGGGDIKFAFCAGLILGWERLVFMVLIASVIGSVVMVALRVKNKESREIPFAPFLTGGLIVSLLAGDTLIDLYMSLLSF